LKFTSAKFKLQTIIALEIQGTQQNKMSYFRITLMRSAIGLPGRTTGVLKALGLKKRMATVFHRVTPAVAGQIVKVKELISVQEVDQPLTKQEVYLERKPDPGYYIECDSGHEWKSKRNT
jgi:large subunit ribosomal protein L30